MYMQLRENEIKLVVKYTNKNQTNPSSTASLSGWVDDDAMVKQSKLTNWKSLIILVWLLQFIRFILRQLSTSQLNLAQLQSAQV